MRFWDLWHHLWLTTPEADLVKPRTKHDETNSQGSKDRENQTESTAKLNIVKLPNLPPPRYERYGLNREEMSEASARLSLWVSGFQWVKLDSLVEAFGEWCFLVWALKLLLPCHDLFSAFKAQLARYLIAAYHEIQAPVGITLGFFVQAFGLVYGCLWEAILAMLQVQHDYELLSHDWDRLRNLSACT